MTNDEMIAHRLEHLENLLEPLSALAKSAAELRQDMAPRVNEAVHALIAELADVEADFHMEDLVFLIKNMMRNIQNLNFAMDQFKNLVDFVLTAEPLLKTTVPQWIAYVDSLEQAGVFRLLSAGLEVVKKIGTAYSAEELGRMGDGLVRLLGLVQKLTTPAALDLLEAAAELPARIDLDRAQPAGLTTMVRAMTDKDFQTGMGVMLELTRSLSALKPKEATP